MSEVKTIVFNGDTIRKGYLNGVLVLDAYTPLALKLTLDGSETGYTRSGSDMTRKGYTAISPAFSGTKSEATGSKFTYTLSLPVYAYKSSWSGVNETYTIRAYIGSAAGSTDIYLGSVTKSGITGNSNFTVSFEATCDEWIGNGDIYLTVYYTTNDSAQSRLYLQNSTISLTCKNGE